MDESVAAKPKPRAVSALQRESTHGSRRASRRDSRARSGTGSAAAVAAQQQQHHMAAGGGTFEEEGSGVARQRSRRHTQPQLAAAALAAEGGGGGGGGGGGDEALSSDEEELEGRDESGASSVEKELRRAARRGGGRILRDKLFFIVGVLNVIVLAVCGFDMDLHSFLPIYYTIKFPILLGYRFVDYFKQKYHLFMLDFCYSANTAVLLYLWFFYDDARVFTVLFALSHGPLAFAVLAFRNSMVFHSIDKITSLFIHISPPLLMYIIRWYPTAAAHLVYAPRYASCLPAALLEGTAAAVGDAQIGHGGRTLCARHWGGATWLHTLALPVACFAAHQLLYFLVVQAAPCTAHWRKDKRYLTSFRYLTSKKGGVVYSIVNCAGKRFRIPMYALFNLVFCAATCALSILWYNSQVANAIFLFTIVTVSLWNGSGFYFEVFARRYHQQAAPRKVSLRHLPPHARQEKEKGAVVDEAQK